MRPDDRCSKFSDVLAASETSSVAPETTSVASELSQEVSCEASSHQALQTRKDVVNAMDEAVSATTSSHRSFSRSSAASFQRAPLFSRADVLTGTVLLALSGIAGAGAWWIRRADDQAGALSADGTSATKPDPYVVIQNYQGMIYTGRLSDSTEFDVVSDLGTNHIVIAEGSVRISFSDCHNQVCVNAGWIKRPGSSIACLPHKLLIEVVNDPAHASKMV